MGRSPAATPFDELNLLEQLLGAKSRLSSFGADNPAAQLGIKEADAGIGVYERSLKHHYDAIMAKGPTALNKVDLTKELHERSNALETVMKSNGLGEVVQKVKKEHVGAGPVAGGLLDASKQSPSKSVQGAREELKPVLEAFLADEARRSASGHSVFDKETLVELGKAWTHYDNSIDYLGICLRNAGIPFDPVYAGRSKVKSTARLVLQTTLETEKKGASGKKAAGKKGEGDSGSGAKKDSGKDAKGNPDSAQAGKGGATEGDTTNES